MDLLDYGYSPSMLIDSEGIPARITAVHKKRYELVCESGLVFGRLKSSIYYRNDIEKFPTTGDFVLINYNKSGDSQIIKTLERKSVFIRNTLSRDKTGHTNSSKLQVVAANFDYVFIMQSLNFDFNINRLERYLTLSWESGAIPVIVLTKADLVDDFTEQVKAVKTIAFGVKVYVVSIKTGYGIAELIGCLEPRKTVVFLGSSGVGKSSLVNALAGNNVMTVNEIRKSDSKGRHTTTHRQLIMLNSGVMIIDTPGMRELGMWDVSVGLGEAFTDIEQYLLQCKFNDCRHQTEPGCAIKAAIKNGELPEERWNSYQKLQNEAKFSNDKYGYLNEKQKWNKELAKWSKENKKNGGSST